MNEHLEIITDFIESSEHLSEEEKNALKKAIKAADRDLTISEFKLERTEKVKRTTAILLEETIEELEQKRKSIEEANAALSTSLEELKATQAQLIQSEKMASLGELTAGIAHEIQNPLNFVNNFSELSRELLDEMKEEMEAGNLDDVKEIAADVIQNLEKINHHGKRADGIVKGMLQHSRTQTGSKGPTDINALTDEYLRLAYHGLRAKDKSFNADIKTDFDESIGKIDVIPQDIGRVILNLFNNAFYACAERSAALSESKGRSAVNEKKESATTGELPGFKYPKGLERPEDTERFEPNVSPPTPKGEPSESQADANDTSEYKPTVTVATSRVDTSLGDRGAGGNAKSCIQIRVTDNGNGIPKEIIDKIFQPFFTTKPTGQGTGLGLSLSYDIVKAHGGELKVETNDNEGTIFTVLIPVKS